MDSVYSIESSWVLFRLLFRLTATTTTTKHHNSLWALRSFYFLMPNILVSIDLFIPIVFGTDAFFSRLSSEAIQSDDCLTGFEAKSLLAAVPKTISLVVYHPAFSLSLSFSFSFFFSRFLSLLLSRCLSTAKNVRFIPSICYILHSPAVTRKSFQFTKCLSI